MKCYGVFMAKKTVVSKSRAASARGVAKKAAPKRGLAVVIDYPASGEIVRPGHYALRLTSSGAEQLQVRFDGGQWQDCRESLGHFWYDWAPQAGRTCVMARARAGSGRWSPAAEREVVVTLEGPERDGNIFA